MYHDEKKENLPFLTKEMTYNMLEGKHRAALNILKGDFFLFLPSYKKFVM